MLTTWHPLSTNVGTDFADKPRSLADSDHEVCFVFVCKVLYTFTDLASLDPMRSGYGQVHWDRHCRACVAYKRVYTVWIAACSLLCQPLSSTPGASASKWRFSLCWLLFNKHCASNLLAAHHSPLPSLRDNPTLHPTGMCCVIFQLVECWIQDK
jgi:hypothetical protein